ncbi:MAG: hypothetical protein J5826_01905 [Bacteroidales bacterium]|nr:hypothetical protein [Bacteroidales bacterium]
MAKKTKNTTVKKETVPAKTESAPSAKEGGIKTNKIVLFSGLGLIILAVVTLFVIYGRVRVVDNAMENSIAAGSTCWLNKMASPDYSDIVAYIHPETDSVVASARDKNYYQMCRRWGASWVSKAEVVEQDIKHRPTFVSRCTALPGDIIEIRDNHVIVNKKETAPLTTNKNLYYVVSDGIINPAVLDSLGLTHSDIDGETDYAEDFINLYRQSTKTYSAVKIYSLTSEAAKKLSKLSVIKKIDRVCLPKKHFEPTVFPYTKEDAWNESNFGPLIIPQENKVIKFSNVQVAKYYRRAIEAYEGNKMDIKGNKVFINGKESNSYRFTQNYYFVLNDNRASKNDSRFFGLLPEKYIVGVVY